MALGGYASTAVTALTAQNTRGVAGVMPAPPGFVALQMRVVLADIGADVVKTGMLGDAALIEAVCDALPVGVPVVVDPVMVASSGDRLLPEAAVSALRLRLLPRAAVLTPNLPETEMLCGMRLADIEAMRDAARRLLDAGAAAVLLKGGHLAGDTVFDLLATPDGVEVFAAPRIDSRHTHGTGCTLASAVAVGLAQGMALRDAVLRARAYVRAAIAAAPGLGRGHGPLGHHIGDPRAGTVPAGEEEASFVRAARAG